MEAGKGGVGAKPKGERESRKGGKRERERERTLTKITVSTHMYMYNTNSKAEAGLGYQATHHNGTYTTLLLTLHLILQTNHKPQP